MEPREAERRFFLQPGQIFVSDEPYRVFTVLGSCVAVCAWDPRRGCGGMSHQIYPRALEGPGGAAFGAQAVPHLLRLLVELGAKREDLRAHLVGGGANPSLGSTIGDENVALAEEILARARVAVVSRDVGGLLGRKVAFSTFSGEIAVYKIERIRETDWYGR